MSKILMALDLSRHTGWAVFINDKLYKYGLIEVEIKHYKAI